MIDDQIIQQFDKMIKEQAWKCYQKLHNYSMYDIDDLYNEGTMAVLKQIPNYNKDRASESTFFHKVLTSHFSNLVKKENNIGLKRLEIDSNYILENQPCNLTFKEILFKDSVNNLSNSVKKAISLAINPPTEFLKTLENKRKIHAKEIFRFLGYKYGMQKKVINSIRSKILNK